jgi:response regulator RpfG family c-di-GMP phosphodiesterase
MATMISERRGRMYNPEMTDAFLKVVSRQREAAATERAGKQYTYVALHRRLGVNA